MFRTDLLSIFRSLNTVYTAIDICHASYVGYVECLLAIVHLVGFYYDKNKRGVVWIRIVTVAKFIILLYYSHNLCSYTDRKYQQI